MQCGVVQTTSCTYTHSHRTHIHIYTIYVCAYTYTYTYFDFVEGSVDESSAAAATAVLVFVGYIHVSIATASSTSTIINIAATAVDITTTTSNTAVWITIVHTTGGVIIGTARNIAITAIGNIVTGFDFTGYFLTGFNSHFGLLDQFNIFFVFFVINLFGFANVVHSSLNLVCMSE